MGQLHKGQAELQKQLEGYSLTTAHILYYLPDFPKLLQSYIWQDYDKTPDFPTLNKFLQFWQKELDGPLHSVQVAHKRLIGPVSLVSVNGIWHLH